MREWPPGAGRAVEPRGEGEVRVGERGADEVGGVGGDVPALVVGVDRLVEPHELLRPLAAAVAHHVGVVGGPVEGRVRRDERRLLAAAAVDGRGERRELRDHVEGVLEDRLPVLALVDALLRGAGLGGAGAGAGRGVV